MTTRVRLRMNRGFAIAVGALLISAAWMYGRRLGEAPTYLSPDEAIIAVDAHSLASTGRDARGERLPLYFRIQMPGEERSGWFTPAIFYASASTMKVLPFTESTIRVPTVVVGLIDIVLVALIVFQLFDDAVLATLGAALLALTPAHFILSRYGLDYLYPLPFILTWFLCFALFLDRGRPLLLWLATTALGIGMYSYISSVLMMPLYLVLTLIVLSQRDRFAYLSGVAAAGFALPLIPLAIWLLHHPAAVAETVQRYGLYDARRLSVLQGLREYLSYPNVERLVSLYWTFFNPGFLFFSGDSQMMFSTRAVGVFLLPIAVLLPIGAYDVIGRRRPIDALVLAGFVTAPLAAVLVPEPATIIRAVALLPFGVLLATYGVARLWRMTLFERPRTVLVPAAVALIAVAAIALATSVSRGSRPSRTTVLLLVAGATLFAASRIADRIGQGRAAAMCLILAIPIQFMTFDADYHGDYRVRSSSWLGGNLRGALETLMTRAREDNAPMVYFSRIRSTSGILDTRNRWMDAYWRFYLIKHQATPLLSKTGQIDTLDIHWMQPGSLVLANAGDRVTGALLASGQLEEIASISELDGPEFFVILRR